jgi:hypothetical protein
MLAVMSDCSEKSLRVDGEHWVWRALSVVRKRNFKSVTMFDISRSQPAVQGFKRNIHGLFQTFLPGKAHGYCGKAIQ